MNVQSKLYLGTGVISWAVSNFARLLSLWSSRHCVGTCNLVMALNYCFGIFAGIVLSNSEGNILDGLAVDKLLSAEQW